MIKDKGYFLGLTNYLISNITIILATVYGQTDLKLLQIILMFLPSIHLVYIWYAYSHKGRVSWWN